MYNTNIPTDRELPSTGKLVKSTILAAIAAVVILVTVVMPAEYGIDPTGVGNAIGLKKMGEIKMSLAKEAEAEERAARIAFSEQQAAPVIVEPEVKTIKEAIPAETSVNIRSDEMKLTLAPDEGTEVKVTMAKGKTVNYIWETNGGKANFDVHADSKELNIDYHGYEKGSLQKKEGIIEAVFDGKHGWFWRNRTSKTIIITLKTNGEYTEIKEMK